MDNNIDYILRQFQTELDKQDESSNNNSFATTYRRKGDYNDVPTIDDDDDYKTHIGALFNEAKEDEESAQKDIPSEEEDIPSEDVNQDMSGMSDQLGGEGGEGGMGGMGGIGGEEDEGPKTKKEVGQAFELKKIYSRLISIESFLNIATDENLIQVRNHIGRAIELFRTVISNFDLYKEKIDEIIVEYYKFIIQVYDIITKHFKNIKK